MISVLVIEDNKSKFDAVKKVLIEAGINESFIELVDNKDDALDLLKYKAYEIVILDFQLPTSGSYGSSKSPNAGFDILKVLKHDGRTGSNQYKLPSVIIALTEFNNLLKEQVKKFSGLNTFAYHYGPTSGWEENIKSFILDFKVLEQSRLMKSDEKKLIITVHGIMSLGKWQNDFKSFYKDTFSSDYPPVLYKYHYFPVLGFLIPKTRKKEEAKFKKFILEITERYPDAVIDIIAHSFGTHLVYEVLNTMDYLQQPKVSKIILCGSVLNSSTDIDSFMRKLKVDKLLNECGINDWPLLFSHLFAKGLGKVGRDGFESVDSSVVVNRFRKGGHGCFFDNKIFSEWVQFSKTGDISDLDERAEPGLRKFFSKLFSR
ncbi:alpha/beta hydrolase [Pseudoalteromonas rhizosphaerae]|uniref:Alpha/beta hydrolase n=1 Tax=Pseudoalteromonas rhizosphaerae TaxID=2518973 RepID=A0ABW8KXK4_9GAMM